MVQKIVSEVKKNGRVVSLEGFDANVDEFLNRPYHHEYVGYAMANRCEQTTRTQKSSEAVNEGT